MKVRDDTCMVDYGISSKKTEPRVNIDRIDRNIGPGYYYAKDDLVKPAILGFKIVEPTDQFMKEFKEIDRRLPLDINYDLIENRIPGGLINPTPDSENPLKFLDLVENGKNVSSNESRDLVLMIQTLMLS